ncbi:MAG TPA: hypothetical protein VJI15_05375 [Candidatus Nanoarchaeia archaeon]|nr:hypothetical protein [Candidatus Nanoarchaeia archaeon]
MEPHPHSLVGAFVRDYDAIIRPSFQRGDATTPLPAILDACDRARVMDDLPLDSTCRPHALGRYQMAIDQLRCVADGVDRGVDQEVIQHFIDTAERYVAEVDLILSSDETYRLVRYGSLKD